MSDTLSRNDPGEDEPSASPDISAPAVSAQPRRRAGRGRRLAVISAVAVVVAAGVAAAVVAGLAAGGPGGVSVRRVHVAGLAEASMPVAAVRASGETVLMVGAQGSSRGAGPGDERHPSGMIMLVHLNGGGRGGAVVSMPATAEARPSGMGSVPLESVLTHGGRSLLVQTVAAMTGVAVNHYAVIDFARIPGLVNAVGGVSVTLPKAVASGRVAFHAGVNHLGGAAALAYVRAPSLTAQGRVLREQNLLRAIMRAVARRHLLAKPTAGDPVFSALTRALTVDTAFSASDLEYLASRLSRLGGDGAFVTAPSEVVGGKTYLDPAGGAQLWQAVKSDSVAAFAARYPSTATPADVP